MQKMHGMHGVERAHIILPALKELQSAWYGVLDFDSMMHVIVTKHPACMGCQTLQYTPLHVFVVMLTYFGECVRLQQTHPPW